MRNSFKVPIVASLCFLSAGTGTSSVLVGCGCIHEPAVVESTVPSCFGVYDVVITTTGCGLTTAVTLKNDCAEPIELDDPFGRGGAVLIAPGELARGELPPGTIINGGFTLSGTLGEVAIDFVVQLDFGDA